MLRPASRLHVGEPGLLRRPGQRRGDDPGATVLDVDPPGARPARRGHAAGRELASWPDPPSAADLLRRHGLCGPRRWRDGRSGRHGSGRRGLARRSGPVAVLRRRLAEVVAARRKRTRGHPHPPEAARSAPGLPDRALVGALAHGQIRARGRLPAPGGRRGPDPATGDRAASLAARIAAAVRASWGPGGRALPGPDAGRLREL